MIIVVIRNEFKQKVTGPFWALSQRHIGNSLSPARAADCIGDIFGVKGFLPLFHLVKRPVEEA